jgi:hypothetical protein
MSVNKLWSRINGPNVDDNMMSYHHDTTTSYENKSSLHSIKEYETYGIDGDPLTWFACIFSALIHDVDHTGVPNAQLVKEDHPLAAYYDGKSIAEQNSFDIAWDLLLEPNYQNLRHVIYVTAGEFRRFRQLVVNSLMATDICDKELKAQRNKRWETAFDPSHQGDSYSSILKATIVIDHLIQASDVAHTMQHWHIYLKWNERFFEECYKAYREGRADVDPSIGWYKGEIGFFDFYIIPLAKKLKDCGVFGVSSDEYLDYAMQNRMEWEKRGMAVVEEMKSKAQCNYRSIMKSRYSCHPLNAVPSLDTDDANDDDDDE